MSYTNFSYKTSGEKFYNITQEIQSELKNILTQKSGVLFISTPHTSCALTINEAYEDSARIDLENFLKKSCPREANFITHTTEGPDDSPSHMKALIVNQHISLIVENSELLLGTWQGIYLCEFRDEMKKRQINLKFIAG